MAQGMLQTSFFQRAVWHSQTAKAVCENWLWVERESLILWVPVAFGTGIAAWFVLPGTAAWLGFLLIMLAVALLAWGYGARRHLIARVALVAALAALCGCLTIWAKSVWVAGPVLERPAVVTFAAHVERVDDLAARGQVRLLLAPDAGAGLPLRVRVSFRKQADGIAAVQRRDHVRLRARLIPPPRAALPGGYDFARRAWFERIGAVGSGLGPIVRADDGGQADEGPRARLSRHIQTRVNGGSGAIAAALATGDRGGMSAEDDEAMRRAGLAHLLSVSGLHVTAVVAGTMWLVLRLLALSPWLALRSPVMVIAAGGGALTALGYTLLTGGEVPTVRSLLAAILVLLALALGREAISLRLIAAGAMVVLMLWPEALVGPSFQLSFAAVTAIVSLHAIPAVRRRLARRDEGLAWRIARWLGGLLLTGLVVEMALMPIALFHFHRAGLYGAFANMVAIPLTTFVVMPAEALAIALDGVGLGAPAWWIVQHALDAMLTMAHAVAQAPGAVASLPTMPVAAYAIIVVGGLWSLLWRTQVRIAGFLGIVPGLVWASQVPAPDVLVTADGRHVAVRGEGGGYALLRDRAGDFARDQLAEAAGISGELSAIEDMEGARCSPDFCVWQMAGQGKPNRGGPRWTFLAARSSYRSDWRALVEACASVDIVIADRWMPRACVPRWIKADRRLLDQTGGLAITLDPPRISGSASSSHAMPWSNPPTVMPPRLPGGSAISVNDNAEAIPPIVPGP